jgi:hypothetical protein
VQGNVSQDNRFLTTPSDFLAPFSLAVISSNNYDYLDLKHNSFIKEFVTDTTTRGKPRYYAIFDQTSFEIAPVPDTKLFYGVALFSTACIIDSRRRLRNHIFIYRCT